MAEDVDATAADAGRHRRRGWVRAIMRRPLLAANLALALLSLALGHSWYADQSATGDGIALYRPVKGDLSAGWQFDFKDRFSDVYASTPWEFTWGWYTNFNGRLSQALTTSVFTLFSPFADRPEDFPWWFLRAPALFCMAATPLLVGVLIGRVGGGWGAPALATAALWAAWSLHKVVYENVAIHIFTLVGHLLPTYLALLVLMWLLRRPFPKWRRREWASYLAASFYLSLFGEQFLPSFPILFLAVPAALWFSWGLRARAVAGYALLTAASAAAAAGVYFLSPGQAWRNLLVGAQAPKLTVAQIADWYRTSAGVGYGLLLSEKIVDHAWLAHALLTLAVLLGVAVLARRLGQSGGDGQRSRTLVAYQTGVFSLAFLAAYHASLATLLVSDYFPPRGAIYPAVLLGSGLAFTLRFLWVLTSGLRSEPVPRRTTALVGVLVLATLALLARRNLNEARHEHHVYRSYDAARRSYLESIIGTYRATGARSYVLRNGPIGDHIFEARGLWAYLQWRGYPQILAYAGRESALRGGEEGVVVTDYFGEGFP